MKILENCWKHVDKYGNVYYRKTSNLNSVYHREDGPAVEYASGGKYWYINGKLHRTDGPAIEWTNGGKEWYINDKCHREDGPAIECVNGNKSWYYHGKRINVESQEEFEIYIKNLIFI